MYFNPRAPYGARRRCRPHSSGRCHFNPRAPYGARQAAPTTVTGTVPISIHAPHTGRDYKRLVTYILDTISIHAPHTGRDQILVAVLAIPAPFQSTRPIRGATHIRSSSRRSRSDFNPRAPYGARPTGPAQSINCKAISIHAPHTGRDRSTDASSSATAVFQSTRPIRGATPSRSVSVP